MVLTVDNGIMFWYKKWIPLLIVILISNGHSADDDAVTSGSHSSRSVFPTGDSEERQPDHMGELRTPTRPSGQPPQSARSNHSVVNVVDEDEVGRTWRDLSNTRSGWRRRLSLNNSTPLTQELLGVRNELVKKWSRSLMSSQFGWYRGGNIAEAGSQICQVVTPVLSGCAAGFKNDSLALTAMCVGIIGVALARFSNYAHRESAERGDAANKFLLIEGVPPIVVIKDTGNPDGS